MKLRNLIVLSFLIMAYGIIYISLSKSGHLINVGNSSMSAFSSYTVLP